MDLSDRGVALANGALRVIDYFCKSVYVPKRLYWGMPALSITSSIFFFSSSEVTKLAMGKLGAIFLAAYGVVVLCLRLKNFGR